MLGYAREAERGAEEEERRRDEGTRKEREERRRGSIGQGCANHK